MNTINTFIVYTFVAVFLMSCASGEKQGKNKVKEVNPLSCIVVMPVSIRADSGDEMTYDDAHELRRGAVYLNGILAKKFASHDSVRMLKETELDSAVFTRVQGGNIAFLTEIGKKVGCEGVLLTKLTRFHQREGGCWAANSPASAAFEMELVDTREGRIVWGSSFDETQETLFTNLLGIGKAGSRGFKFITVEELLVQGLEERIEQCPYL